MPFLYQGTTLMEQKIHIRNHMKALNMTAFKFREIMDRVQLKFIFWQVLKWCHVLYNLYHLSIRVRNRALEMFNLNISVHCAAQQPVSRWWPDTSQMRLRQNIWMVTIESMPELVVLGIVPTQAFVCLLFNPVPVSWAQRCLHEQ